MIPHHVLGCQIFDADDIILTNNFRGQLMLHIPALVGDMLMESCYLNTGFVPILTALCFSGQLPLEPSQLLFRLPEVLGVGVFHPIGGNSEGLDTYI